MPHTSVCLKQPATAYRFLFQPKRWARACGAAAAAAGLLLALVGCGGGGGSDDAGPGKTTLTADLFPLAVGDRSHMRTTTGADQGRLTSQYVTGTTQLDGRTAFVLRGEGGETYYQALTATGLLDLPGPGSNAFAVALGGVEFYSLTQAQGETRVPVNRTLALDVDGDGRADSQDVRYEVTFLGYEDVTTALGTFKAAAKIRLVASSTTRFSVPQQTWTTTSTLDSWLAPGIGAVRSASTFVRDGGAPKNEVTELFAYNVGPLRSERIAPTLLLSSPQANAVVSALGEIELDYSEELDPYVLTVSGAPLLKDANDQTVPTALRLSNNGKRLVLTPVTPLGNGRYQVQSGNAVTDFAGNAAAATTFDFTLKILRP